MIVSSQDYQAMNIAIGKNAVGGKATNLARLEQLGFPVPSWFCVASPIFQSFITANHIAIEPGPDGSNLENIRQEITGGNWPEKLAAQVLSEYRQSSLLGAALAVRSSGIIEDSDEHSCAGQFASVLNVRGEADLLAAIKTCWASAFNKRLFAYCEQQNLGWEPAVGVVVQQMIAPDLAGVMFTRNPTGAGYRDEVLIESVPGVGEALVSGAIESDRAIVARDHSSVAIELGSIERYQSVNSDGGLQWQETTPSTPRLSEDQAQDLARIGLEIEAKYGRPQDIEWVITEGRVAIVQTRPVVTLPANHYYADETITLWDNANIVESYAGITLPLTFSHAVIAYEKVYQQFCRVMGVPEDTIADNASLFRNMLGSLRGRVYYNLLNWYRLVYLFPNADRSRSFMETMMGTRESLGGRSDELFSFTDQVYRPGPVAKLKLAGLAIWRFATLKKIIGRFVNRVNETCDEALTKNYQAYTPHQLMTEYDQLCDKLLDHWQAPLINDCRCMLFFGILKSLSTKYFGDEGDRIQNELLSGQGDLFSAQPLIELQAIASDLRSGKLTGADWLKAVDPEQAWDQMTEISSLAPLQARLEGYLIRFGFRSADELKLEVPDWLDNPAPLFANLQTYLSQPASTATTNHAHTSNEVEHLSKLPALKRSLFRWVLKQTRRAVADREHLRYLRGKTFGVARRLFRAMGERFYELGAIATPQDIFYLTIDELRCQIEGRGLATPLRDQVAIRTKEYNSYSRGAAPPDRLLTYGPVGVAQQFPQLLQAHNLTQVDLDSATLQGTPCCPGVVSGAAHVAKTYAEAQTISGGILVAERTDPGWVPLFASCEALLVERGSLLSHSAVVAREMGLPTIVGVPALTDRVETGEQLSMDGSSGLIHKQ